MNIGTNRLYRWHRDHEAIEFFKADGGNFSISFATVRQAEQVRNCIDGLSQTPEEKSTLLERLRSSLISNPETLLDDLIAKGVLKPDDGGSAAEAKVFHRLSERDVFREDLSKEDIRDLMKNAHSEQYGDDHSFPEPQPPGGLESVFADTLSSYSTTSETISEGEMSTLLALAYGRHQTLIESEEEWDHRGTTASGGGFYPLKPILMTRDSLQNTRPFVLQYQRSNHSAKKLEFDTQMPKQPAAMDKFLSNHGLYLLVSIMIDLRWSEKKYGNHAYRFALLEAGAIMQNLRLVAPWLGLRNWPCGFSFGPLIYKSLPALKDDMHAVSIGFGKPPEN